MPTSRSKLVLLLGLVLPFTGLSAQEGVVNAGRPAEYMIYQYPLTTLVLRIDVPEAEFSGRTVGPEGALIKSSAVPGRRLGPVYQIVDPVDLPRQLMIEVTPGRALERATISLQVLQFAAGDRNVAAVTRAYQLFSLGTEKAYSSDTSTWASKAYSLRSAAGIFASLGMEEMRLWSEYFSAHLVFHQLKDPVMALELVEEVASGAARAGFEQVELAARVLESEAVMQLAGESGGRSASGHIERAHAVLADVTALAQRLGLEGERGRALFQDGRVFELQGDPERAMERYQEAMAVTARTDDADLLNQVRATAATVYESMGSTSGALEMLEDIADDLVAAPREDAELELADRLVEKGRLLNSTYRYAEATAELSRALDLQQASASKPPWGPTGLELAWSRYSLGEMDEALRLLESSLPRMPSQGHEELLVRAYESLANIYRDRQQFDEAEGARNTQRGLIGDGPGQAGFLVEAAIDARQRDGAASAGAQSLLQRALQAAAREGDRLNANRASLYLCLLQSEQRQETSCDEPSAQTAFEALRGSGIPRVAVEAGLARSRILHRSGRTRDAGEMLERLMDDLHWYRRALPGVLGAWYVENRDEVVREYLSLARESGDGRALLLAMERVRMLEAADFARPGSRPLAQGDEDSLRDLLARRVTTAGEDGWRLAREVDDRVAAARSEAGAEGGVVSATELGQLLDGLGRGEAVLSYYFADARSQALLATRRGVQTIGLPGAAAAEERLDDLRESLAGPQGGLLRAQLDALGRSLLGPLAKDLPDRVYLLPTGPLLGIPFDALRLEGKYFGEGHTVVNLVSLASIARRSPVLPRSWRDSVFVAGNPQQQGDPFSLELRVSPEIAAVTDRFVGPGLHVVQGVALQKHEFADPRFGQAGLIHLAIPGSLDLSWPDRSRLLLVASAAAGASNSLVALVPADVRGYSLAAQLVVLSGTKVVGRGQSDASSRLAFVADFLEAGARAVLVSIWPAGETIGAEFAADLYGRLQSEPDLERAFQKTRQARIRPDAQTNLSQWAGFQLFIR